MKINQFKHISPSTFFKKSNQILTFKINQASKVKICIEKSVSVQLNFHEKVQ